MNGSRIKAPAVILHYDNEVLSLLLDFQPQLGGARMFDGVVKRFLDGHQRLLLNGRSAAATSMLGITSNTHSMAAELQKLMRVVANIIGKVAQRVQTRIQRPKDLVNAGQDLAGFIADLSQLHRAPSNPPATLPARLRH